MLSKNQIKHIRSLHQAKYRKAYKLFLIEGPKIVDELILSNYNLDTVLALDSWIRENQKKLPETTEIIAVTTKELERISLLKSPNEVVAVVQIPEHVNPSFDATKELVLMLDGINDPGNMGTIVRTADWFGIQNIICSINCVELYNPKVIQSTMGSLGRVNVQYLDLVEYLKGVENIPVYGALLQGKNMYNEKLTRHGILIIGSESHGISRGLLPFITHPLSIPAYPNKGIQAESLNASIATAILCAEFRRISK